MAKWIKWSEEQQRAWDTWVAERPLVIRNMIAKYNLSPDNLYRLGKGNRVILTSLEENGTVTVKVLSKFNQSVFPFSERTVFDVDPEDLKECEWEGEVMIGMKEDIEEA